MKFKKARRPKNLSFGPGYGDLKIEVSFTSSAASLKLGVSETKLGPRRAIELSKWLVRYVKWSSLQ